MGGGGGCEAQGREGHGLDHCRSPLSEMGDTEKDHVTHLSVLPLGPALAWPCIPAPLLFCSGAPWGHRLGMAPLLRTFVGFPFLSLAFHIPAWLCSHSSRGWDPWAGVCLVTAALQMGSGVQGERKAHGLRSLA